MNDRVLTLLVVADVNALVDAITPEEFTRDERLPYWAELWPSSIALGNFCLGMLSENAAVLEIGCGLGLAGLCAVLAGAEVIMTDYESDALAFARYNCERNLPSAMFEHRVGFRQLDWRHEIPSQKFDVVLGSDVLYERSGFEPITRLLKDVLRPGGCAWFTDPQRSTQPDFVTHARHAGFCVTIQEIPGTHESFISLLTLRDAKE